MTFKTITVIWEGLKENLLSHNVSFKASKKDAPFNKGKFEAMQFLHIGVKSVFFFFNAILTVKFPLM